MDPIGDQNTGMLRPSSGLQVRGRLGMLAIVGGLTLVGCTGCDGTRAVIATPATDSATPQVGTDSSSASPQGPWQPFILADHVMAWLPTGDDWVLAGQGKIPPNGSFVTLTNERAGVGLRVQGWRGGDQSAASLCAQLALEVLAVNPVSRGSPTPAGNPIQTSELMDAFSCEVTGLPSPKGWLNYHIDVVVRVPDGATYTQVACFPSAADADPQTQAALGLVRETFWRTLSDLDQH